MSRLSYSIYKLLRECISTVSLSVCVCVHLCAVCLLHRFFFFIIINSLFCQCIWFMLMHFVFMGGFLCLRVYVCVGVCGCYLAMYPRNRSIRVKALRKEVFA